MMRTSGRVTEMMRRGHARATWLGALALTGLMALPVATAPLAHAKPATVHFRAPMVYRTSGYTFGVATGDVNGDGIPDIVTANFEGGGVDVFLGNGDGGFRPAVTYDVGYGYLGYVALGDFNGDGKLDIAVADIENASVQILLNN